MVKQLYNRSTLQKLLGIPLKEKKDHITDTSIRNEALDAVRGAWRNGSDMEESEAEQGLDNHSRANSDVEERSLYSMRSSQKRRRLGNSSYFRKEMSAIYVAESEGGGDQGEHDSESELNDGPPLERRRTDSRASSSNKQTHRAYWASKGLSGGPESGSD